MKGAHKSFLEAPERFLEHNLILSPKIQTYVSGKLKSQGLTPEQIEAQLPGIYEFDLLPYHQETFHDGNRKKVNTYLLSLLEMRPLATVAASKMDLISDARKFADLKSAFTTTKPVLDMSKHKVTSSTHAIRAFYVPWDNDRTWTLQLDNQADFCFTPTLDGCSFVIGS